MNKNRSNFHGSKIFPFAAFLIILLFLNQCTQKPNLKSKPDKDKKVVNLPQGGKLKRTVLILADDKSEKGLGKFPWPRSLLSKVLDRLHASRIVLIGFYLDRVQNNIEDGLLIRSIQRNKKVILQAKLFSKNLYAYRSTVLYGRDLPMLNGLRPQFSSDKAVLPYVAISDFVRNIGFTGLKKQYRANEPFPLVIRFHGKIYPTLPLAVFKEYYGLVRKDFYLTGNRFYIGLESLPLFYLNKYPNYYPNLRPKKFSYIDVLHGKYEGDPFAGKVVIISYDFERIKSLYVDGKRTSPGVIYAQWIESVLDCYDSQAVELNSNKENFLIEQG